MSAVYALRRPIKLSFACTRWRKSRESLKVLKSTPSNRQFESCGYVFAPKSIRRTAKREWSGWGGIRTPGTFRYTRFPGVHNRPLCHPSKRWFLLVLVLVLVNRAQIVNSFRLRGRPENEEDHELQLQPPE